jgi:internalin A
VKESVGSKDSQPEPPLKFAQEPSQSPEYFVSYAWGDDTPDGVAREIIVDQMCNAAERRRITILRDKKALGLGDRISKFMQRIGRGDRIFVVLSDKYLKSPFCMYELSEVWRRSQEEDEAFLKRIRVYTLPDAKIWTPLDRARCAAHWKKESSELEALVKEAGIDILGNKDFVHYRLLKKFAHQVGDILATIADIVQPRSFEEFEKYGLDPPDTPEASKG